MTSIHLIYKHSKLDLVFCENLVSGNLEKVICSDFWTKLHVFKYCGSQNLFVMQIINVTNRGVEASPHLFYPLFSPQKEGHLLATQKLGFHKILKNRLLGFYNMQESCSVALNINCAIQGNLRGHRHDLLE